MQATFSPCFIFVISSSDDDISNVSYECCRFMCSVSCESSTNL